MEHHKCIFSGKGGFNAVDVIGKFSTLSYS